LRSPESTNARAKLGQIRVFLAATATVAMERGLLYDCGAG
jgi:hypothetical protein